MFNLAKKCGLRRYNEDHLLTHDANGTLRLWQIFDNHGLPLYVDIYSEPDTANSPRCYSLNSTSTGSEGDVWFAQWLDNNTMITAGYDGSARRWSLTTDEVQILPNVSRGWREVVWEANGHRVLTYTAEQYRYPDMGDLSSSSVHSDGQIWDFELERVVAQIPGPIASAFWLASGLLISRESGEVLLFDPSLGVVSTEIKGHTAKLNDASLHHGRLATATNNGLMHVWDIYTGQMLAWFNYDKEDPPIKTVVWNHNGRYLLTTGPEVALWDTATGNKSWHFDISQEITAATYSPEEQYIAVASNTDFFILDAKTGAILWHNQDHTQNVVGIQWVQGTQWNRNTSQLLLMTWSSDGTIRLWNPNRQIEFLRMVDTSPIEIATMNHDGSRILTVGCSGILRVWQCWPDSKSDRLPSIRHSSFQLLKGIHQPALVMH